MSIVFILILVVALIIGINEALSSKRKKKNRTTAPSAPVVIPEPPAVDTRPKLIIDTDAGPESDPDDCQPWISQKTHVMQRNNLLGFVGTSIYGVGSVAYIRELLDLTGTPKTVAVVQGAIKANDLNTISQGAQFYIDQLSALENEKLEIHIWGSCSTLAQALKARPDLANRIAFVYWVANGNRSADPAAWDFLRNNFTTVFILYRDEEAFRGMMRSGDTAKLTEIHQYIQRSKIGNVWNKYTAELIKKQPSFWIQGWKNGDLTCYLFSINPNLRDRVFKRDVGKWFVADGKESERAMAADGVRDWMVSRVKANVDLYQ